MKKIQSFDSLKHELKNALMIIEDLLQDLEEGKYPTKEQTREVKNICLRLREFL